jgi:hypothetical protein
MSLTEQSKLIRINGTDYCVLNGTNEHEWRDSMVQAMEGAGLSYLFRGAKNMTREERTIILKMKSINLAAKRLAETNLRKSSIPVKVNP